MRPFPYRKLKRVASAICLALSTIGTMVGNNTIVHNGITHYISGDTVLLDRDGIFNCPEALKDPVEAFARINKNGKRAVLLVAPSVYWLDDPDDPTIRNDKDGTPYAIGIACDTLSIIGLTDTPEDVVFAVNRGQTQGAVGNFTMFHFKGHCLTSRNLTFGNYCNVDLEYPRNTMLNRPKRKDAIVQAQIGICEGTDRLLAENSRFISRLNLCPFVGARRSLYDKCYFECTDDALSGSAIYLDCDFTFFSSKPFYSTAETGAIFLNCDITCLGKSPQYFTKVPGLVTAIDTRFHSVHPIDIKWTRDASDIICRQENITLNGMPYIIDSERLPSDAILDRSPLRDAYKLVYDGKTVYNLPNLLNGHDAWDPKGMNAEIGELESKTGLKLTGLPVALRMDIDAPSPLSDGDEVLATTTPLLWSGEQAAQPDVFRFKAENSRPLEKKLVIPCSTPEGLSAQKTLTIAPKLRPAPKFKKKPKVSFDNSQNKFRVDYSLSGKGVDDCRIVWCRVMYEDGSPRVFALKQTDGLEGNTYQAKAGDLGFGIMAVVFPKFKDSKPGPLATSSVFYILDPSHVESIPESSLSTDFSEISIVERKPGLPGVWSFDVFKPADTAHVDWQPAEGPGWYYGKGFDSSTGFGIVQSEKGARMSYVPSRDICSDMSVSLIAEPAKSGGQGFGSATTQYMDICVKFDPVNLDGYALRIERTPDHDRAVRFSLVKYDKGSTNVISEEVVSDCYRNPCHISVGVQDGFLYAKAHTEAPVPERRCCEDVIDKVELKVPVEESTLTGFAIQHTGSVGPSSTLLRSLNITWQ